MQSFLPKRVFFEPEALEYPLGKKIYNHVKDMGIPIKMTGSHNRVLGIPGKNQREAYVEAKNTVVVGIRKSKEFSTCRPSANYQIPLNTSCPSMCEYCYLATTLGKKPYVRVYVNLDDIFEQANHYIAENIPEVTVFEGAATSDPIPTEYITGILKNTIEFFGKQKFGRFRFVTKHIGVDTLLDADHNGHTRFRYSINAEPVIRYYEHKTPALHERLEAANKVAKAGFPLGFIVAPIFLFDGWKKEYELLFKKAYEFLYERGSENITFEFITHRFTKRAKSNILQIFPHTKLQMEEAERKFKYGQFGYGKYVYKPEQFKELKLFMLEQVERYFPAAKVEYFV